MGKKGYAKITVRGSEASKKEVPIGSPLKPEIVDSIINKWQSLIDSAAQIVQVPAGLIMKLNKDSIEVFLKSDTEGNPYKKGEEVKLDYGLYCETAIGTQKSLLISDATKDKIWKVNNPDINLNMISYLGFPINWPDGEVFGTVCLLDNKENQYTKIYKDLLHQVKQHIETDLQLLVTNKDLKEKTKLLEQQNIVKSKLLSLISHDVRGALSTTNSFLELIISRLNKYSTEDLKEILQALHQGTDSAFNTLEDMLRWAKNDLLELKPNKKSVDLVIIFKHILAQFENTIKLKDLQVTEDYCADAVSIYADEEMIRTSLRNIFSNATKYTDSGGKIAIRVKKQNDETIIEIEDTGIGMSETTLQHLFSYNNNHAQKGTKGETSTGIGLFLTKDFLDKHGASVEVSSALGEGTKFRVKI